MLKFFSVVFAIAGHVQHTSFLKAILLCRTFRVH
nr:MAG TPA: hypothetical protein [Caudoviricetes sp.]